MMSQLRVKSWQVLRESLREKACTEDSEILGKSQSESGPFRQRGVLILCFAYPQKKVGLLWGLVTSGGVISSRGAVKQVLHPSELEFAGS